MPVPPGLLMDIAILVVREFWRSRRRRTAPVVKRAPASSRAPARRLSLAGRILRLAVIAGVLWLIWREVTRRRAALIEARRAAVSRAALAPGAFPTPSLPPAPAAPRAAPPPVALSPASEDVALSVSPVEAAEQTASATGAGDVPPSEHAASAEPSPVSEDAALTAPPVESAEQTASAIGASDVPPSEHAASDDALDGEEIRNGALIGWCARCRARHPMRQVTFETNAVGRSIARGVCSVCGAGITRFVAREQMERGNVER